MSFFGERILKDCYIDKPLAFNIFFFRRYRGYSLFKRPEAQRGTRWGLTELNLRQASSLCLGWS